MLIRQNIQTYYHSRTVEYFGAEVISTDIVISIDIHRSKIQTQSYFPTNKISDRQLEAGEFVENSYQLFSAV